MTGWQNSWSRIQHQLRLSLFLAGTAHLRAFKS